jgi:hypothetical protein
MSNQRLSHLEAQVARRERPQAQAVQSSGHWNWVRPETIASGSDSQDETSIDLSSIVGVGAVQALFSVTIDYPDPGDPSVTESCTIYSRSPDVSADLTIGRLLSDDQTGFTHQATLPLTGSGFVYWAVTDPSSPTGRFDWTLEILAWM